MKPSGDGTGEERDGGEVELHDGGGERRVSGDDDGRSWLVIPWRGGPSLGPFILVSQGEEFVVWCLLFTHSIYFDSLFFFSVAES